MIKNTLVCYVVFHYTDHEFMSSNGFTVVTFLTVRTKPGADNQKNSLLYPSSPSFVNRTNIK